MERTHTNLATAASTFLSSTKQEAKGATMNLIFFLQHPSSLLTTLFLLFFSFYSVFTLFYKQRKMSKLPPGTLGWCPYLGHTLSFLSPHLSNSRGCFLEANIQRYGKIFRSHLFGHPTIVSCDADFNSFILQNEENLFESSYPTNIPGVLGDMTLLVTTGDLHKRLRGVVVNYFSTIKNDNCRFLSDIEGSIVRVMGSWRKKKTLRLCEETRKFTFSVIVNQILSLGTDDPETDEILHNFNTFMKGLASLPINLPGTPYTKAIHGQNRIKEIARMILRRRIEKQRRENQVKLDFMDALMHAGLSEKEILSLVLDLLLGGYETTAMLIATIVRFLSDHPRALDELREEHGKIRGGKKEDERLGWNDYKCMTFTHHVINEVLRCGNIVKFVHRKATKSIHYKGFEIPADWKVLPIFAGVHLDSLHYSNPLEFNPWRWKEDDEKKREMGVGNKGFMPFGGGKRLCPGSEQARLETAFFLHHLVLNFSWVPLIETDRPMSFPFLDFKQGFPISIHPISQPN